MGFARDREIDRCEDVAGLHIENDGCAAGLMRRGQRSSKDSLRALLQADIESEMHVAIALQELRNLSLPGLPATPDSGKNLASVFKSPETPVRDTFDERSIGSAEPRFFDIVTEQMIRKRPKRIGAILRYPAAPIDGYTLSWFEVGFAGLCRWSGWLVARRIPERS